MFITLLFIKKWRNHTKASINFFAVLAMLVVPWVAQGQAINYTCDFDDPSDTAGTACELLDSFPWTENFESCPTGSFYTGSSFIPCWGHLNNGTTYGGYPYVNNSSGCNHTPSGNKGLYWSSSTSTNYGDYCCVVLPEIDSTISIDHLKLSFWVKGSIYTTPTTPFFQIGVMTDPTDISTFVGVDTIAIPTNGIWTLLEIPLSAYIGNGHNIAIKADRASSLWTAFVDDMTIDYLSCIVPQQVFETNATTNSISFDWIDITPAIEWQIEYGPQGYTRGSLAGTLITTTTHPVTITGLDTLATYDFYIRPICTAGDTAGWGYPTSLTTAMCDNSSVCAIGSANSTGSTHCYPVNNYYNYSLSETIIDSTELGGPMDIEYIGYYYDHTAASTDKSNCTIYFQPTAKTVFCSSSDVEALNPATGVKVYEGHLNCSHGWNIFPLDTVYHYDGSGNLMIIVDDNSNDFNSISYTFKFEPCSGYKTLYYFSSTYNPDVTSITSAYGGFKEYAPCRAVTQLISCTPLSCHQPVITGTSNTYEDVTVTWSGESNSYEVNIKPTNAIDWPTPGIIVTGNSYTFHGLQPATDYTIRVRQDCRTDNLGYSEWVTDSVITYSMPCLTPDSLHTSEVTNATATFDWSVNGNETYWDIHVWHSDFDSVYRVNSRPCTLGGFSPGQTYDVAVRAICGSELHEGDWSDTIQFNTEQQICDTVTDLTATNVTESSALLAWTPGTTGDEWEVILTDAIGVIVSEANTTEHQYAFTGLMPGTDYIAKVRTDCGDGLYSDFVSTSFTTETLGINGVTAPTCTIYPNPYWQSRPNGSNPPIVTISVSGVSGKVRIVVVDIDGRGVATETLNCTGGCTRTMEVDKLAQGTYFVRIIGENANMVKKLIVR